MEDKFIKELETLINKYSMENDSNTPDYILAEYLSNCLKTFNTALQKRAHWYGETAISEVTKYTTFHHSIEDEAVMLEKAASDHNYYNYCARATLGISKAITPYELLDNDYCRVRSASEREEIKKILERRNVNCDTSNNAYNDWEITLIRMNGCPCGHNGKTVPYGYAILKVRVGERWYATGDKVRNDGVIEKFTIDSCGRVIATVDYKVNCPFRHYTKFIDIVNL